MIKILHCGDIHLDSPFQLQDAEKSDIRRNELRGTFSSLTLYAKSNNIDLMLIAGDLFDSEYVTKETVALVCREFASIPECRIVISPGNHDPYTENSVYARTAFPDNVYLFDSSSLSYFSFDDIGVDVYGYAFTSPTMTENPFAGHTPKKSDRINILCAHGDTRTPISNFCPITASDIKNSRFDYIALGHYHDSDGVEKAGDTYYAYSGCLEGRDFGETGHKGAIYAEMSKDGGVFSITSKGLRFSKRRYEAETLDVSGACDDKTVQSKIKALLADRKYGSDTALRITLTGSVSPDAQISERILVNMFSEGLFALEIKDQTLPLYNYEVLKNDPTIRGALFEKLLPILENGTPQERKTAALALKVGLAALAGSDVTQVF